MKYTFSWCDQNGVDRNHVKFVYEDGDKHRGQMVDCVQRYYGFKPISERKKNITAFEACDFIAWESNKASKDYSKSGKTKLRQSFDALLDIRYEHRQYSAEKLREVCLKMKIKKRESY